MGTTLIIREEKWGLLEFYSARLKMLGSFYVDILTEFRGLKNKTKLRTLESLNLMSFFILLIEIAKKKKGEILSCQNREISTGNSMICSDIWHKYRE